jgi:hypothetical protein
MSSTYAFWFMCSNGKLTKILICDVLTVSRATVLARMKAKRAKSIVIPSFEALRADILLRTGAGSLAVDATS